ncbi:uncharacterized protein BHQ10_005479 [Talaromyces amestolkiae]|uniref:FAD-binding domain-containing protein n=1 Tax=Talaromyces amestolkiae TaxID=1196081 RepID=A0A364L0X4_TALAM|nr:uncharacterized protein BHQ10_005479 [Talaromyces amestolkiae]RAO69467.1 hypothetical protein BHQ10_005479 [Talaromyces amestolkiae]
MPGKLRVAIIGAGPAGLGAAIEFQKLPFVDLKIYDQARALREIGTGISIQKNTWRMLDAIGASQNIKSNEIFRPADGHSLQHRCGTNGRTGELLVTIEQNDGPPEHFHARALRSVLQKALLSNVDKSNLRLGSRLVEIVETPTETYILHFQDGHVDEVDLLVGADGVRSVVRSFAFPDHKIAYTGRTAYRGLVPTEKILSIPNFPDAVTFWHGPSDWVYTCNLNGGIYEITVNADETEEVAKVSWGEKATLEEFKRPWKEFAPIIHEVLDKVKDVQKFALFAGPRLESVVSRGSIALVGDASHPLSGAFGAGAGFALEDAFALVKSVAWARSRGHELRDGLNLYDRVRSPHYQSMVLKYRILDDFKASDRILNAGNFSFDEGVAHTVRNKWHGKYKWLFDYDGAGEESTSLSNVVNAVVFGTMTVLGFISGMVCNRIGVRWTLVIGSLGYAPYAAALYTNAAFGNKWFPILGAATCGISAVFLWTASGAINLVVGTKFAFQNIGGFIGGAISLGLNIKQNHAGRVSDATYFAFISIMCIGLPLAATIPRPSQIKRNDGTQVVEHRFKSWNEELSSLKSVLSLKSFVLLVPFALYCQWDLSYMWTWNAVYHTVRARALLSTLFYLVGPSIIGPVQGWLLDRKQWSRRSRARYGMTAYVVVTTLTWIYGLIVQYQYDERASTAIDIVDPVFIKSSLLFILYGLIENSGMMVIYWIIGSLGLDPGKVASLVGLVTGIGSFGSTLAFVLGACNVTLKWQLWANVITFLASLPGFLYVSWTMITEDNKLDEVTTVNYSTSSIESAGVQEEQGVHTKTG